MQKYSYIDNKIHVLEKNIFKLEINVSECFYICEYINLKYVLLLTFYSFHLHACIRTKPSLDNSQPWDKTHKTHFCGFFFTS